MYSSKEPGQAGQRLRRVSLPAPISPNYNFASPSTTGGLGRKVSVRRDRLGTEERKLSMVWARHTPGSRTLWDNVVLTAFSLNIFTVLTFQFVFMISGMLNKFTRLNDQH